MDDFRDLPNTAAWLAEPPDKEASAGVRRLAALPDVARVAIFPDVHRAGPVCVGVALATRTRLYPEAGGTDIGCGMLAVPLREPSLGSDRSRLTAIAAAVPTNRVRRPRPLPEPLDNMPVSDRVASVRKRDGRVQFGTLGRGNHFVEVQEDDEGNRWLLIHTGSRAVGPAVHAAVSHAEPSGPLAWVDADSKAGRLFLADAAFARAYATANRRAIAEATVRALGTSADWESAFETVHDRIDRETHGGELLWVHRKGTQPLAEGEAGVVPGSMGTETRHVVGRATGEDAARSLGSVSHGAGRRLRRGEARKQIGLRELARQLDEVMYDGRLADALRDEAPSAYRDLAAVMRAQRKLMRTARRLRPVLVHKGR